MVDLANETEATFPEDTYVLQVGDTDIASYAGMTFSVDVDIDDLDGFDLNSVSTRPGEEAETEGAVSISLPTTLFEDLRESGDIDESITNSRIIYNSFRDGSLFQQRPGSDSAQEFENFELGSVIVSAGVPVVEGRIENLRKPVRMSFQKKQV